MIPDQSVVVIAPIPRSVIQFFYIHNRIFRCQIVFPNKVKKKREARGGACRIVSPELLDRSIKKSADCG